MNAAATPQPPPQPGQTPVLPLVLANLQARAEVGLAKYGTPLMVDNGRGHLVDALQEGYDLVMYLRAAVERQARAVHLVQMMVRTLADSTLSADEKITQVQAWVSALTDEIR